MRYFPVKCHSQVSFVIFELKYLFSVLFCLLERQNDRKGKTEVFDPLLHSPHGFSGQEGARTNPGAWDSKGQAVGPSSLAFPDIQS